MRKPGYVRGNPGRNRSAAQRQNKKKFLPTYNSEGISYLKRLRSKKRRQEDHQIVDCDLLDFYLSKLSDLKESIEEMYLDSLDYDPYENYGIFEHFVEYHDYDSYDDANYDDIFGRYRYDFYTNYIDPTDSLWKEEYLSGCELPLSSRDDDNSHDCYSCECGEPYWDEMAELLNNPNAKIDKWGNISIYIPGDSRTRLDKDRNAERLRSGERYYHQNHRTVNK